MPSPNLLTPIGIIFKQGDDLRQDMLVIQVEDFVFVCLFYILKGTVFLNTKKLVLLACRLKAKQGVSICVFVYS